MQPGAGSGQIHEMLRSLPGFGAVFSARDLPDNGIYFFYEKGETFDGGDRIVRVGTHVGDKRLGKRLKLHYAGRARRSVFRRNVGNSMVRAGLVDGFMSDGSPLHIYEFDLGLETAITVRLAETFSFSVVPVDSQEDRFRLEAGLIGSLSAGSSNVSSAGWLGNDSPVDAIRKSGLWNKMHVGGMPMSPADFELLQDSICRVISGVSTEEILRSAQNDRGWVAYD